MTPFRVTISVEKYESLGYNLKAGDVLFHMDKIGHYFRYAELISYDEVKNIWIGKTASATTPISKVNTYISMMVVPFDQYVKKMGDKSFSLKK